MRTDWHPAKNETALFTYQTALQTFACAIAEVAGGQGGGRSAVLLPKSVGVLPRTRCSSPPPRKKSSWAIQLRV